MSPIEAFLRSLLSLLLWRRPRFAPPALGPGYFLIAAALCFVEGIVSSSIATDTPREFSIAGGKGIAAFVIGAFVLVYLITHLLRRPALLWPLATYSLTLFALINLFGDLVWALTRDSTWIDVVKLFWAVVLGMAFWLYFALNAWFDWYGRAHPWPARLFLGGGLIVALFVLPFMGFNGDFYQTTYDEDDYDYTPDYDSELLMSEQFSRVDAALAKLRAQTPGQIDLYVLTFGGDGAEDVFRNETFHAARLFGERFGAEGRVLSLINNAQTLDSYPLATRSNLRRALLGLGKIIDRDEDLVVIVLSSHGSKDPEIYVAQDYLPLNNVAPGDVAEAISDAGIRYRGVIISACYAGGFIPALRNDAAAVLTAARADRTSFGCGADSDITYFGRALFVEALNASADLDEAFAKTREAIAQREREEKKTPSEPQAAIGAGFDAQWRAYIQANPPGEPVAFAIDDGSAKTTAASKTR